MPRRRADPPIHGLLLVDKPSGLTSHDVVARARQILGVKKIGHAGTLDPLATGLLCLLVGEATKLAAYTSDDDKAYETTALLGVRTDTLDADGQVTDTAHVPVGLTAADLEPLLARLRGTQSQRVPAYSAVQVDGRRLYERARAGEVLDDVPTREITVLDLELLAFEPPRVTLRVACSKGTYIRQLVSDLGDALGCGAHVAALRRTRVGAFDVSEATPLDDLEADTPDAAAARLIALPVWVARAFPCVPVDADVAARTRQGQRLSWSRLVGAPPLPPGARFAMLLDGEVVALAEVTPSRGPDGRPTGYRLLRVFGAASA